MLEDCDPLTPEQHERMIHTDPSRPAIMEALRCGEISLTGQFAHGSNACFLVSLHHNGIELDAVYKPVRGENPLWDFPARTLAKRETAACLLSEWLGWDLVPPTVFRKNCPLGAGSLQLYIPHDPQKNYFTLSEEELQNLKTTALFDLVMNNADRKGSHLIFDQAGHLWLIDHGLCFNVEPKLRTVIWNFAGEPLPFEQGRALNRARQALSREGELFVLLHGYLSIAELNALKRRIDHLLDQGIFPHPPSDRRSFPYPPL